MREITAADFLPAQPPQLLGKEEIHLWFFPHWEGSPHAVAESPQLRALLAAYLACAPADLRIVRDEHGKPRLLGAALQFNLSHSGGRLLVGVSCEHPLGVDLEVARRERPVLELARRWFAPAEAAALAALAEADRQAAFLRLWSCKEAVLKALGRGISFGLDRVVFDLTAPGEIQRLQQLDGEPTPSVWRIVGLRPATGCVGALAWRGPERPIRAWTASSPPP